MPPSIIDYYKKENILSRWRSHFSARMRQRMLADIPLKAGMRVLEVGVTPVENLEDANFFSLECQKAGCDVAVKSPEDCSALAKQRGWQWISFDDYRRANRPTFDLVISAAVIEHVGGSRDDKLDHLRTLNRASKGQVVVTTPHRYHWMEVHTKLPFIHWLPKAWHRFLLRRVGMKEWAAPEHLDLMDWQEFRALISEVFPKSKITFRRFWFLGAPSNLLVRIEKS